MFMRLADLRMETEGLNWEEIDNAVVVDHSEAVIGTNTKRWWFELSLRGLEGFYLWDDSESRVCIGMRDLYRTVRYRKTAGSYCGIISQICRSWIRRMIKMGKWAISPVCCRFPFYLFEEDLRRKYGLGVQRVNSPMRLATGCDSGSVYREGNLQKKWVFWAQSFLRKNYMWRICVEVGGFQDSACT